MVRMNRRTSTGAKNIKQNGTDSAMVLECVYDKTKYIWANTHLSTSW